MQLGSYAGIHLFVINMTEVLTHKLGDENKNLSLLMYSSLTNKCTFINLQKKH